jgi:hypothetical protein
MPMRWWSIMKYLFVIGGMKTTVDLYAKDLLFWCANLDMIIKELYELFLLKLPQRSNLQLQKDQSVKKGHSKARTEERKKKVYLTP